MYKEIGLLGDNSNILLVVAMLAVAYLIGNISPAILIGRAHGIDIKKEGSGNAGTTNVLRTLGGKAAAATLVIDILKGTFAVFLGGMLLGKAVAGYCVAAVVCGHIWPMAFSFKGGKGVATVFGALMGYNPVLGLMALGTVAVGVLVSQRMSFGSVMGAALFPVIAYFKDPEFLPMGTVLALIIIVKHRSNIVRLIKGEEPKLGQKKKEKTGE